MTKNRPLTWMAAALVVAFMAAPAMAQVDPLQCYEDCVAGCGDPRECREQCYTGDGDPRDPVTRTAEWLEMTEGQIGEWHLILETMGATLRPLLDRHRALEGQLREAMRADNPDRELIGRLMLALRTLGAEIGAVKAQAIADMIGVLTPEQVEMMASRMLAGAIMNDRGGDRGRGGLRGVTGRH